MRVMIKIVNAVTMPRINTHAPFLDTKLFFSLKQQVWETYIWIQIILNLLHVKIFGSHFKFADCTKAKIIKIKNKTICFIVTHICYVLLFFLKETHILTF